MSTKTISDTTFTFLAKVSSERHHHVAIASRNGSQLLRAGCGIFLLERKLKVSAFCCVACVVACVLFVLIFKTQKATEIKKRRREAAKENMRRTIVTFDCLLYFGPHCAELRRKVRPRVVQLRKLTGRSWGLEERQLRTVAKVTSGGGGGALQPPGCRRSPPPPAHVELIARELRAAARAVGWHRGIERGGTGCALSGGGPRRPSGGPPSSLPAAVDRQHSDSTWTSVRGPAARHLRDPPCRGGGAHSRAPTRGRMGLVGRLGGGWRGELQHGGALLAALEAAAELPGCRGVPVVACLDSKAALLLLALRPRLRYWALGCEPSSSA
ncbi:uncharacterized protein LOC122377957 [Amphibalanus amphitrite]|uniref:uncharacterized protein LOC122377957 n=1 Tax=Amphibalanus amphitrite TaxID=1232801 RepID=UPI001C924BDB|nr:uncharacterized protein LOC122377957 [Amphibalanus amphitrite]